MPWLSVTGNGKRARDATFSDAAIQFCLMVKALYGLPLWQSTGLDSSLLALAGLDWAVPDYSTLCRRQKPLAVEIPCRPRQNGLHLLIDSTGVKMIGEGEWKTRKHGAEYRRQWRKVHLGIDAETLEVRAVGVTSNSIGDALMLPDLLAQIPETEAIASVSGDGAYGTKSCHACIASRNAAAIIPVRKNGKPWKENKNSAGTHACNEALRATHRLGRDIWKRWSRYHRRSLVETRMRCLKLLGERALVRFTQDRNGLRFGKSALSHDSLSSRKPSSQVLNGPKIAGQVKWRNAIQKSRRRHEWKVEKSTGAMKPRWLIPAFSVAATPRRGIRR